VSFAADLSEVTIAEPKLKSDNLARGFRSTEIGSQERGCAR
jgi:hypothetical protein